MSDTKPRRRSKRSEERANLEYPILSTESDRYFGYFIKEELHAYQRDVSLGDTGYGVSFMTHLEFQWGLVGTGLSTWEDTEGQFKRWKELHKQPSNRIVRTYERAMETKKERDWDRIYVIVDLHGTVLAPNYEGLATEFYPHSKCVLKHFSDRKDIILIMWTCSTEEDRTAYNEMFAKEGIKFDYINENPEVKGKLKWGDFDSKMYANLVLDDKAGFEWQEDWQALCFHIEANGNR
jgi:hypothetical protein